MSTINVKREKWHGTTKKKKKIKGIKVSISIF